MAIWNTTTVARAVTRGFRKAVQEGYGDLPLVYPQIFEMGTGDGAYVEDFMFPDIALAAETGELVAPEYIDLKNMWSKRYTFKEIGLGVSVSRTAFEDDLYDVYRRAVRTVGQSMRETEDSDVHTVLNGAFAVYTSPDGVFLCAANHPVDGGGTESNLMVPAQVFSRGALETLLIQIARATTYMGRKARLTPTGIIYPDELWAEVDRVLDSKDEPDSANNATNPVSKRGLRKIQNTFLTVGAQFWFVLCKEHRLSFISRQAIKDEFDHDVHLNRDTWVYRRRYAYGCLSHKGLYGSNP